MRTATLVALAALLAAPAAGPAQPPAPPPPVAGPKPPPDETKAIVREIEEAYKAPSEVDADVRDELHQQYKGPTPEREAKLLYEIRRLYQTTPAQEDAIRAELRRAYQLQTPEQETRLFVEIRRNGRMPPGAVHPATQAEQAGKLFRKLDLDGDGRLSAAEAPADLRRQSARWDRDADGAIDAAEYEAYFLARHQVVAEAVAAGDIVLKLPKGVEGPEKPGAAKRAAVARAGKLPPGLPAWFAEYDTDGDGQVGLYEWRRQKRPTAEFVAMDGNADGYLTARELLAHLAAKPPPDPR